MLLLCREILKTVEAALQICVFIHALIICDMYMDKVLFCYFFITIWYTTTVFERKEKIILKSSDAQEVIPLTLIDRLSQEMQWKSGIAQITQ